MFKTISFPKSPFFRFFCPSLQPVAVVKRIIAALNDQHSQTIYMPFYVNFGPYVGLLPSFLRDLIQKVDLTAPYFEFIWIYHKIAGADYAMVNFVKLSGLRPDEVDASLQPIEEQRKNWYK